MNGLTRKATDLWRRWPRTATVAVAAAFLGVFILIAVLGVAGGNGAQLWIPRSWLSGGMQPLDDSWNVMARALEWLRGSDDRGRLYQEIFFEQGHKFQYAPTSLLFYELIEALGAEPTTALMNEINRVVLGLTAAALGALAWVLTSPGTEGGERMQAADIALSRAGAAFLAVLATLVFYPITYAYEVGQIQLWIVFLFVVAAICWKLEQKWVAGVFLGVACLIKPQFGLFLIWGLLRREWVFSIALAATGTAGLLTSIIFYGFPANFAYLEVLSFISQHGESFRANQSINGVMHRLFENGDIAEWNAGSFAPYHPIVYVTTLATTVALLLALVMTRRNPDPRAGLNDFLLASLVFTMASPVAWEHHYGVLMPVFVALLAQMMAGKEERRRVLVGLALMAAFVLTASRVEAVWPIESSPANLLHAHLLLGAVIVLVALWSRTGILPGFPRIQRFSSRNG